MDLGTLIGLACAFGALGISVILEGGSLGSFFVIPAAIIVFGGTTGAVVIGTPVSTLMQVPAALKHAFFNPNKMTPAEAIARLVELSRRARREGILGLESEIEQCGEPFLQQGLQLVVDGTDGEALESILKAEMRNRARRHSQCAGVFAELGGLAPTLGVTGTVMGLVHMMERLNDPSTMGPAIAGAFCATLYGVASANVVYLPIAAKLEARSKEEKFLHSLILEGLTSLQAGENALTIEERLKTYLPPAQRDQDFGHHETEARPQDNEQRAA
jgi:chemotaxis protein MotA